MSGPWLCVLRAHRAAYVDCDHVAVAWKSRERVSWPGRLECLARLCLFVRTASVLVVRETQQWRINVNRRMTTICTIVLVSGGWVATSSPSSSAAASQTGASHIVFAPNQIQPVYLGAGDSLLRWNAMRGNVTVGGQTTTPLWLPFNAGTDPNPSDNVFYKGGAMVSTKAASGGAAAVKHCSVSGADGSGGSSPGTRGHACSAMAPPGGSGNGAGMQCSANDAGAGTEQTCSAKTGGSGSGHECSTDGKGGRQCSTGEATGKATKCSAMSDTSQGSGATEAMCSVERTTDTSNGECSADVSQGNTENKCSSFDAGDHGKVYCSVTQKQGTSSGSTDTCTSLNGDNEPVQCSSFDGSGNPVATEPPTCSVLEIDSLGNVVGGTGPDANGKCTAPSGT